MSTGRGGFYRKQVYEYIESIIGRVLTIEEHRALRLLLKEYVNDRTSEYQEKITEKSNKLIRCERAFRKKRK